MLDLPKRSKQQLSESLKATLKRKPTTGGPVGLFVYGLLAKEPPFKPSSVEPYTLYGWHRFFNLWDPLNRGTPAHPGLTLGLEPGNQCQGLVFTINSGIEAKLMKVWEQEMLLPFYKPTWFVDEGLPILVMITDKKSPAYEGKLSAERVRTTLARAGGKAGSNTEYLEDVRSAFATYSIRDRYLEQFTKG